MGLRGMVEYLDMEIMIQVWLHNCFEHHQSPEGYAIYFMPSFCSHSCLPNALWCTDNDSNFRFFPRATIRAGDEVTLTYLSEDDIRAGDEVTLTYLSEDDMLRNTSHRRQLLEGAKDFKCMCESADETGDEEEFGGALLRAPTTSAPVTEEQRQRQGSNSASHSPIPEERSPDTWRQPLGPQSLYPETARGSADWSGGKETPAEAATNLSLHTIWARLLAELKNDTAVQEHETDAASVADAGAAATPGTSPFFSKTSGIVSTQVAAQVLQGARNGCCCSCRRRWRDSERLRALAVERILEDVFNSLDNPESEIRDGADKSPANSLSGVSGGSDRDSCTASSNSNDSDARAHELLQRLEPDELLHIVKKKWNLLEKNERRVVDAIIKLTFNKHCVLTPSTYCFIVTWVV
ncbi:uncharacterized protein EMH_0083220 [Eimeria mitis]|uniref:SET domain-containing protein n=1 Tax=Eimeria mitis TaxID=44415 RepID=U6KBB4_9EIME|nr:uncharacterized protein EMH_0083220 [Eimeria mitis]CDJ33507.1 hypothetical protein, conserved [Eimeria mitis]